jgi:hypothetical protein
MLCCKKHRGSMITHNLHIKIKSFVNMGVLTPRFGIILQKETGTA